MGRRATFDSIRTLSSAGISGSYAAVGSPTTKETRGVCFTNNTQGDMYFSLDGTNDHIIVPAGNFKLWDVQANMAPDRDDRFVIPIGTQFSVKQIEAPVDGSVYIELLVDD